MAKRNMYETAQKAKGNILPGYDMRSGEMIELYELANAKGIYKALSTAFNYGFVLGGRQMKKELTSKKPSPVSKTDNG